MRCHGHVRNFAKCLPIFKKKFTVRIDSKFAIKLYLKIPPYHNHAVHYLVKYLCSKNRRAQEVSAAKCLVDLATQKNCFKIFV